MSRFVWPSGHFPPAPPERPLLIDLRRSDPRLFDTLYRNLGGESCEIKYCICTHSLYVLLRSVACPLNYCCRHEWQIPRVRALCGADWLLPTKVPLSVCQPYKTRLASSVLRGRGAQHFCGTTGVFGYFLAAARTFVTLTYPRTADCCGVHANKLFLQQATKWVLREDTATSDRRVGQLKPPRKAGQASKGTQRASQGPITSRCSTASSSRPSWGAARDGYWAKRPLDTHATVSCALRPPATFTGSKRLALRDGDCGGVSSQEAVSSLACGGSGSESTHPRTRACRAPRRCGSRAAGDED